MQIRRRAKVALAGLFAVLVAVKSLFEGSSEIPPRLGTLEDFGRSLEVNGYQFAVTDQSFYMPEIAVFKSPCIYNISIMSAEGATENYYSSYRSSDTYVNFLYDGKVYYTSAPRWWPIIHQNIYKLLNVMKWRTKFPAIYVIRSSQSCPVPQIFMKS